MFHSGIANNTIDVVDKWLGRIPGRLSLLAAGTGVLFAALSGSTLANTAMLGTVLLPEMRRRGYKSSMSVGPIIGWGAWRCSYRLLRSPLCWRASGTSPWENPYRWGHPRGASGGVDRHLRCRAMLAGSLLAPRYEVARTSFLQKIAGTIKYVLPWDSLSSWFWGSCSLALRHPRKRLPQALSLR